MPRRSYPIALVCLLLAGLIAEPALSNAAGGGTPRHRRHAATHAALATVSLLANGGFENERLRPWRSVGTRPASVVSAASYDGHAAALVGRLTAGPAVTSTMAVSVSVPARATSARISLLALQRCTTTRPHSRLTLAWQPTRIPAAGNRSSDVDAPKKRLPAGSGPSSAIGTTAQGPALSLLDGCGDGGVWTPLSADLAGGIGHTIVITASAAVATHEAAALLLDDVQVTATLPLSAAVPLTATPAVSATATVTTTPALSTTATVTTTPGLSTTATITAASTITAVPTSTPTDVPNLCVSAVISAAYNSILPTFTPTRVSRPAVTPAATITGTVTPTRTPVWWYTATPTPSSTPTSGPTPGYTVTPGPSPTVGTSCHAVAKGISFGFVTQDGGPGSAASPVAGPAEAHALAATGARMVRLDFHLSHDDTWTPAEYAAYDTVVDAFRAEHIDVLGLVGPGAVARYNNPAAWQANSMERSGGNGDNAFLQSYAARVLDLVSHFQGRIATWELWNEPNVRAGGIYMYPSNFAAMLADTYMQVKHSFPNVTLVSGGILSDDDAGHSNPQNAGADYLRQTYAMGLQVTHTWDAVRQQMGTNPLDAVGQHLYLDQGGLVYTRHIVDAYRWMHDAYAAFGDGAKPLYMTEGAWSTSAVSPAQQALNLDMLYSMSQSPTVPYVARVYWYLLRDGHDPSQAYGLQTPDGLSKQAFFRFLAY